MKILTIILFVTIASAVALSVLFQNKIEELSTELDDVRTNLVGAERQLTKAKGAQKEAEREMNVAQDQSETAYVNLNKVQRQLTEQKKRADQLTDELADQRRDLARALTEKREGIKFRNALSQLQNQYSLKVAEYQTFEEATAQALAAKDKRISELNAELSAAQNKN
ncbi:hypothetical protein N8697_00725 [bacterium]|nr:hypothetical protein [bacterium]